MESHANGEKLTMSERLELWRAAKLKEMKKNKKEKDSPKSQQRRNTFALSLLPSPGVENALRDKENNTQMAGKRDRKAMKWKDQPVAISSPEGRGMGSLTLASPSPCQETSRRKWTANTPPSPINTHSSGKSSGSGRRPMAERSPSVCNILNNSIADNDGSGYVTAEEEDPDYDRLPVSGAGTPKSCQVLTPSAKAKHNSSSHPFHATGSAVKNQIRLSVVQQSLDDANVRAEALATELSAAREKIKAVEAENSLLLQQIVTHTEEKQQWEARCTLANHDVESMMFLSSVNEQRVEQLEYQISQEKVNQNEYNSKKNRKYQEEYIQLEKEKAAYEDRANSMIMELQAQMMALQESAMGRIASLEEQVMEEGRRNEELNNQLTKERAKEKRQSMMASRIESGVIEPVSAASSLLSAPAPMHEAVAPAATPIVAPVIDAVAAPASAPAASRRTSNSRQSICDIESRQCKSSSRRQSKSSRRQSSMLPPPMLYDLDDDDDAFICVNNSNDDGDIDSDVPLRGRSRGAPMAPLYVDSDEDDDADSSTAMAIANNLNSYMDLNGCGTIVEEEEEEEED